MDDFRVLLISDTFGKRVWSHSEEWRLFREVVSAGLHGVLAVYRPVSCYAASDIPNWIYP